MSEVKNVLVLCMGNVGRSPLIAASLAIELQGTGINVVSRGLRNPSQGHKTANPELLKLLTAMQARGQKIKGREPKELLATLKKHTPIKVTKTDLEKADIVIVATPALLNELHKNFGATMPKLREKAFTVREFITKKVLGKEVSLRKKRGRMLDQVYNKKGVTGWKAKPGVRVLRIGGREIIVPETRLKRHLSEGARVGFTIGKHLRQQRHGK